MVAPYLLLALVISTVVVCAKKDKDDDEGEKKKSDVGTVIGIDLGTTYSWYVCDCSPAFSC